MHAACIIPARGGSKGIPKKNLRELHGKPLIAWTIENARHSQYVGSDVYVTSDSEEILEVAQEYGAKSILRPPEISTDTSTSEAAIQHAVETIETEKGLKLDLVTFLQATSPVRYREDIDRAIDQLLEENADSLFSARPLLDYFIWRKTQITAESTNFDYKNRRRRQDLETTYLENGSLYVFRRVVLFEQNNRLGGKISIYNMDHARSIQVDDDDDLELAKYYLQKGK